MLAGAPLEQRLAAILLVLAGKVGKPWNGATLLDVPLVEPVIRRTLGMIRVKNRPLSAAAERFASLLLLMWTDEARELWCNVVDSHQQL